MFKSLNNNWCEVLGEFWPFFLAVLNDVIGQIEEGQLARYLSCRQSDVQQNKQDNITFRFHPCGCAATLDECIQQC